MAAEPLTLFSHKIEPAGVLALLRSLAPDLTVVGPEDDWERVTVTVRGGLLRRAASVTFTHDRDYYAGPGWPTQMSGMQGYFSRFPETELTPQVMFLIGAFRFSLGVLAEPALDIDSDDERLRYVFAAAKHLDAAIFTPSALRDARGRVLLGGGGDADPRAVMPAIYKPVPLAPRDQRTRSQGGTLPNEDSPPPPTADRVARRALALAAVSARALLEQEDPADPGVEQTRRRILDWVQATGFGDELEPDEWELLQHPLRSLPHQQVVDATWRLEGLAVLAWALGRYDLPPHDQPADPGKLLPAVGILSAEHARALLAEPFLRPAPELKALSARLFAVHWRLRQFSHGPAPLNFREFAATAWFGPLRLDGVRLIEEDLAIGDHPIAAAPSDFVGSVTSAAMERHVAINWLEGYSEVYSETDVAT